MIRPLYIGLGLLSMLGFVLIFVAVMAPASLLIGLLRDDITQAVPALKIGHVSGTIWNGTATVQYQNFPPADLDFSIAFLPLLTGSLDTAITLTGDGLDARFDGEFANEGGRITQLNAIIASHYINAVTIGYGLDLSGEVVVSDANLAFDRQWLTALTGQINWSGGIVHIENPAQFYSVKLPPVNGELAMDGQNLQLVLAAESELLNIRLKPDGWAEVGVSYAMMALAELPVPGNPPADSSKPALLLEEKVL